MNNQATQSSNNETSKQTQELFDEIYNALVWTNEALRATAYALFEHGYKNDDLLNLINNNEDLLQKVEGTKNV